MGCRRCSNLVEWDEVTGAMDVEDPTDDILDAYEMIDRLAVTVDLLQGCVAAGAHF